MNSEEMCNSSRIFFSTCLSSALRKKTSLLLSAQEDRFTWFNKVAAIRMD